MMTEAELIKYKLTELANSDGDQISGGAIEVYWEDANGNEFSTEEPVTEIAQAALNRIIELEQMQAPQRDLLSAESDLDENMVRPVAKLQAALLEAIQALEHELLPALEDKDPLIELISELRATATAA